MVTRALETSTPSWSALEYLECCGVSQSAVECLEVTFRVSW